MRAFSHDIKYVITLDADTSLPQGSANRLIATLAHPLNHAEFAADGRSVVAGYTVLQPRVAIKPTSANRSLFSQIYAGNAGFDLYSFAVSDVYQDLFGEGSYVGKGIYDVAAFERSLAGQVRQNTLLSHDLFEGIYGRAALVTDIVLYEEYPSRYLVYARRLRRWIRGDWQLLPWLFPFVRTENGTGSATAYHHQYLESFRQPAAQPAAAHLTGAARCRLAVPARLASGLDFAGAAAFRLANCGANYPGRACIISEQSVAQTTFRTNPAPADTLGACHSFSAL